MNVLSKVVSASCLSMVLLAATTAAAAEERSSEGGDLEAGRMHESFQLRVGLGGGYLRDTMTGLFNVDGVAKGPSAAFQASAAWAVTTDFFIGCGLSTDTVTDPKIHFEGVDAESDIRIGTLALFGVYLNYYFNDGLHAFGIAGGANISTTDEEGQVDDETAAGFGASGGLGYDVWIADDFTIGAAGRLTSAGLLGDGLLSHSVSAYSVMLTGTYD